jgi:hypothetical protein
MGEPIAKYIIKAGFSVVGIDSSPSMVSMCLERFPNSEWIVADMRTLALGRQFGGVLAWDSLFHLPMDDQRRMFSAFSDHALPGAPLMFTTRTTTQRQRILSARLPGRRYRLRRSHSMVSNQDPLICLAAGAPSFETLFG